MQSKKSRALQGGFQPGNTLGELGAGIPKRKRSANALFRAMDSVIDELTGNKIKWPDSVDKSTFATFMKLTSIGMRDAVEEVDSIKCPKCSKNTRFICEHCTDLFAVPMPHVQMESNQVKALSELASRQIPKMHSVSTEINIKHTIEGASGEIARIIIEYVPPEKRVECLARIRALLEAFQS